MKVNRGDTRGGKGYSEALTNAITHAHTVTVKSVLPGQSSETIYTIKTKEGEKKVSKEVFDYIKKNDIEEITRRVFAEIELKIEREKKLQSKRKGAEANQKKNDLAYKVITDLVREQGIRESFMQSNKPALKAWANQNKAVLFDRFQRHFPHNKRAKLKLPLSESSLFIFQQRFKKESL